LQTATIWEVKTLVDFAETGRQRCRNKQCRCKLPSPTINERHAFCTKGCHTGFYSKRCLVCERALPPGSRAGRKLCKRPKCRYAYAQDRAKFDFPALGSPNCEISSERPVKWALKTASNAVEEASWRIIAGPQLTPSQLHCATVPDGPDRKWIEGKLERIEAQNRRSLEAHFDALDRAAVESDFCNVCGRKDDLSDYRTATGWATTCRECRAKRAAEVAPAVKALIATIPDDLSIPKFLQRTSNKRAAA
jgi:hypothetical protein